MGRFGSYLFDGKQWTEHDDDNVPFVPEPWLFVDIYDSDITTVTYGPAGPGTGIAYLGDTPRTYFEDPTASAPQDVSREAAGLTAWWAGLHGVPDNAAKAAELATYLAVDADPADLGEDDEDDEDLDDAEVFVEIKTARFLAALDLPTPDDLVRWDPRASA